MKRTSFSFLLSGWIAAICASAAWGTAQAELLNLSKAPLFVSGSVTPNFVITVDDSASMRGAYMPAYLEDRLPDIQPGPGTVRPCGFRHPRFYSPAFNSVYYNPAITYEPPMRADGTRLPAASFDAAWVNGLSYHYDTGGQRDTRTMNLGTDYSPTFSLGDPESSGASNKPGIHRAIVHSDSEEDSQRHCSDEDKPDETDLRWRLPFGNPDGTSAAFFFRFDGVMPEDEDDLPPISDFTAIQVTGEFARQNFANWYSYYRTRSLLTRAALSVPMAEKADGLRVTWQNLNPPNEGIGNNHRRILSDDARMLPFVDAHSRDFFNWLFRFRTTGQTPTRLATHRVGDFFRGEGVDGPYYDEAAGMELSCRQNYHLLVTDGFWNEHNPLGTDVTGEGDQAQIALPDGIGQYDRTLPTKIYWNRQTASGDRCRGFGTGGDTDDNYNARCDPTLSDIAFHYWATDLRPDLEDNVPRRWLDFSTGVTSGAPVPATNAEALSTPEVYFNPKNDPASWQHVVNYVVGLGVAGDLEYPASYEGLRAGTLQWPEPHNKSESGIDDSWHAAINSRGEYFSVHDPEQLAEAIGRVLQSVEQARGSVAALTVSSGVASSGAMVFRGGYDTSDWSGFLEAYRLQASGVPGELAWNAAEMLEDRNPSSRVIITAESARGDGMPFRWSALSAEYRSLLNDNPATSAVDNDGKGALRLDYLRGDRSQEMGNIGGTFRVRRTLLGSIVHSGTVVVAAPAGDYDDTRFPEGSAEAAAAVDGRGYARFKQDNAQRRRLAIVGGNDGMLHAFDAGRGATATTADDPGTGSELWAYVPRELVSRLPLLTQPGIPFEPFVDSTPTVRDVFVHGAWRTVLVGGLRRGGQGVYALDITDPNITESDAAAVAMWEFFDDLAPGVSAAERMGYTYGKPNISRLPNGQWVAIVPGGYNNEEAGDGVQGDGASALFVIDLGDGTLVRSFVLPDSYGLAFATMGDYDQDFSDDFAVAGDAVGNLWRFDFTGTQPSDWAVEKIYSPETPGAQPITSAPRIFADRLTGGSMVLFGTGKLIEPGDRTDHTVQSLHAIRERGFGAAEYPVTRSQLVEHRIARFGTGETAYFTIDTTPLDAEDAGWVVDFPDTGERMINAAGALFSTGTAIINTVIPNGGDPCKGGLRGNLYVLDASTGGAVQGGPIVDTNHDGVIDGDDDANAIGVPVDNSAAEGTPAVVVPPGGGIGIIPDYGVQVPGVTWRRRNWREVDR